MDEKESSTDGMAQRYIYVLTSSEEYMHVYMFPCSRILLAFVNP